MKKKSAFRVMIPIAALLLCGLIVLLERYGVTSKYQAGGHTVENLEFTEAVEDVPECLLLTSTSDEAGSFYVELMKTVLDSMRVGYTELEITDETDYSILEQYDKVVVTFQDWSVFGENIHEIGKWVKAGGSFMNTTTPIPDAVFASVSGKLGIESGGSEYAEITGLMIQKDCMIGAPDGTVFPLTDGEESLVISLDAILSAEAEVYVSSEDGRVPIVWRKDYGEGEYVIVNDALMDRYQRGFLCLAYSLMGDACIYPVINGSAYYLDDFPSPVPEGDSEYIKRDYGVSTDAFYSTIWWPKVLNWSQEYGIKYTGMIIELYSDEVESPFERNEASSQFLTFGNMLLNHGGELGFHGYNHMPLCIAGVDDNMQFGDYVLWPSAEDASAALTELQSFSERLFPEATFSVYVPPSNILSDAGKQVLLESCPDIRVIASTYLPDTESKAYVQEFEVEENGVIDTPRITSGCQMDDYQRLSVFAELTFHYVQSHFMHPDDLLDEDRGAVIGWEQLSQDFEGYLQWITSSAPQLRNLTGSEMGTAVLQYDSLSLQRSLENQVLTVSIGGFSGDAYFLMRVNEGQIAKAEGCEYVLVTGNLYEIHATQDEIKIYLE